MTSAPRIVQGTQLSASKYINQDMLPPITLDKALTLFVQEKLVETDDSNKKKKSTFSSMYEKILL